MKTRTRTRTLALTLTLAAFLTLGVSGTALAAADHNAHGGHGGHGASHAAPPAQAQSKDIYTVNGVVDSLDKAGRKAVITHEPVPALNWPVMTMGFVFEDAALMNGLKPGDKIRFDFRNEGSTSIIVDLETR